MKRTDSSSEPTVIHGKDADGGRGLIEDWLHRFFPVWSDMPPYDRANHYSRLTQPGSAVKR
jgi:hypothetical protein